MTLATLMLEVLDTRLLSVLTWYHLSFFAVSVAMLGMAAGAVIVFTGGERFSTANVGRILPSAALLFAIVLPLCHIANLVTPFPGVQGWAPGPIAGVAISTLILTLPFVVSGIVVTLALTRTGGPAGALYGVDLLGAAFGCLAIIWLLDRSDIASTALATGAIAALGAWCFSRSAARPAAGTIALAVALMAAAGLNTQADRRLGVLYPKSRNLWLSESGLDHTAWRNHAYLTVRTPTPSPMFLWGPARNAPVVEGTIAWAAVDGDAGTAITKWDGDRASLGWTRYDVTALPYALRSGRIGIIGVGGGRDILTAIGAGNTSVVGIEVNGALVDALAGKYRTFASLVTHPGVTIVHDEARSFLTRVPERFDVLQMSLIDTWAATGAGAFTLTENGLYTRDGWQVFLRALAPAGVFSVSRWFDPEAVSETTRLVSLGTAALIDYGIETPRAHLLLVTRERIATLVVSPSPFSADDAAIVRRAAEEYGFTPMLTPWDAALDTAIGRIASATSLDELRTATADPDFDFSPPSDARPYFFNMLKPAAVLKHRRLAGIGVVAGNLIATRTLLALGGIAFLLVLAIVAWPLVRLGRPPIPLRAFAAALAYFAIIGFGFMFVQIPFLQRFSVYLGHPTYTFSIILFLMILAAGVGSMFSDRIDLGRSRLVYGVPVAIAIAVLLILVLLQPAFDFTIGWNLAGRTLVVAGFVVPLAAALGCCFPIGLRLVGRHSDEVTAWMWGVNGACGVMGSILAVMASMWLGISSSLAAAALLYLLLIVPMRQLRSTS